MHIPKDDNSISVETHGSDYLIGLTTADYYLRYIEEALDRLEGKGTEADRGKKM